LTDALRELIRDGHPTLVGPVRQEQLSGIRQESIFEPLREHLLAFNQPTLEIADYEEAAGVHNHCRSQGIAGSDIGFLICAVALRRDWQIFTVDRDFARYNRVVSLKLYEVTYGLVSRPQTVPQRFFGHLSHPHPAPSAKLCFSSFGQFFDN
jgi:hypothetical protein